MFKLFAEGSERPLKGDMLLEHWMNRHADTRRSMCLYLALTNI